MSVARIKQKSSSIFWRIFITVVGAALILIALTSLLLFFFGEKAVVEVKTRRVGGADDNRPVDQRYEWSLDYTFTDKNGKAQSGHTTRRGGDMGVKTDKYVYYFSFAPFINFLESEAEPNIGQPLYIVIGILLIVVMNKKKPKVSTKEQKPLAERKDTYEE